MIRPSAHPANRRAGDCDPKQLQSNTFLWKGREFPEVDRAGWFGLEEARRKLLRGQVAFLEQLVRLAG